MVVEAAQRVGNRRLRWAACSESAPLKGIRLPGVLGRIPEHCKVADAVRDFFPLRLLTLGARKQYAHASSF